MPASVGWQGLCVTPPGFAGPPPPFKMAATNGHLSSDCPDSCDTYTCYPTESIEQCRRTIVPATRSAAAQAPRMPVCYVTEGFRTCLQQVGR